MKINDTEMKITMELRDLKELLHEQKLLVIKKLLSETYSYNSESTDGHLKSLLIDEDKFRKVGLSAKYSNDLLILEKYLS